SFAGSFLGEALYRMSNYYLETGGKDPSFFRQLGSALIAPSAAFNRIVYASHDPAVYTRAGIGWRRNEPVERPGGSSSVPSDELVLDFVMDYGLPGKPTYEYTR